VNPSILIVARAHSDAEVDELKQYGADTVIMGEREIAMGMVDRLAQVHHDSPAYEDGHGTDTIPGAAAVPSESE
jgi:CPA2 family monovalent cation:H+ antiporter-2